MSGLETELHGQVRVRELPNLDPEAKAAVSHFDWQSHGLIITRGTEVLYQASDHRANGYDAHVALRRALNLPLDCR